MEREDYQKPEIISDAIEIGVYGIYYENEDGNPCNDNPKSKGKGKCKGKGK